VKLVIRNLNEATEELDRDDLHQKKVIAAGTKASIYIGPLGVGKYKLWENTL
jgi:hypothetical protein